MPVRPTQLFIRSLNAGDAKAILCIGHRQFPCLLGKNGRSFFKREGDGKSPCGRWKLVDVFYRADKLSFVRNGTSIRKNFGWCDDQVHANYNRSITLPISAGHEKLWRDDNAYDLIITTDHNQRPRVRGFGSAIFLHVIREGSCGTEGCIALCEADWRKILGSIGQNAYVVI